jgi:hypothetical protein
VQKVFGKMEIEMNYKTTTIMGALLLSTSFASAETHTVVAYGGFFAPEEVVVRSGDTIDWQLAAGNHTVTSGDPCTADGLFDSPPMHLAPLRTSAIPIAARAWLAPSE